MCYSSLGEESGLDNKGFSEHEVRLDPDSECMLGPELELQPTRCESWSQKSELDTDESFHWHSFSSQASTEGRKWTIVLVLNAC